MSGSTIQIEPIELMSSVQLVFESKISCLCGSLENTGLRLAAFDETASSIATSDRNQPPHALKVKQAVILKSHSR